MLSIPLNASVLNMIVAMAEADRPVLVDPGLMESDGSGL